MKLMNVLGILGAFFFLLKIVIHIFIKRKIDGKFYIGPGGSFLNPILFLPIFDDIPGSLGLLKRVANISYATAVALLLLFVIGVNLQ